MSSSPQAESSSPSRLRGPFFRGGDTAVMVVLVYLYVWLVIDPRLVHHSLGVLSYYYPFSFHIGWDFLWEHLARPGGMVEYASRLLTQVFVFGWCGALVLAVLAWHLCRSTDTLDRCAGRPGGPVLRYVPVLLLAAVYGSYNHPLGAILSLSIALTGFAVYVRWVPRRTLARIASLVVACLLLYHVAGAGGLLFPVLVAIYELLVSRRPVIAAVALCCGVAIPWFAAAVFGLEINSVYGGFFLSDPGLLPGKWPLLLALFLFFPVTLAGSAMFAKRVERRSKARRRKTDSARSPASLLQKKAVPWRCAQVALVLAGTAATVWLSLDGLTRTVLDIDYHSQHRRWEQALAAADRLPAGFYDVRCNRNVMLALCHTGRLGDEMFCYPQRPGVDLFRTPDEARDVGTYFQEGRLFLDMGHVNQAEKCFCTQRP